MLSGKQMALRFNFSSLFDVDNLIVWFVSSIPVVIAIYLKG
jgi:hypothetical protein